MYHLATFQDDVVVNETVEAGTFATTPNADAARLAAHLCTILSPRRLLYVMDVGPASYTHHPLPPATSEEVVRLIDDFLFLVKQI